MRIFKIKPIPNNVSLYSLYILLFLHSLIDSSYVNIRNGMPVNDIPDSDEETDKGTGSRYYNNFDDDEGDEAGYPKEEYDSFISSNGMSRSHLMQ